MDKVRIKDIKIKSFRNAVEDNARIIQPLHGRVMMHK